MNDINTQQVLPDGHSSAAKDLVGQGVKKGLKVASSVAGSVLGWYQGLGEDSGIKKVLTDERIAAARELAKRGTEVAQQVLESERVSTAKEYADQSVKVAHNVAGSVSEWYQELEPGYFSRWGQVLSEKFAQLMVVLQALLTWFSSPQAAKLCVIWLFVVFGVFILMNLLGFGRAGVLAGSIAAAWQSFAYGAFTPLGGFFAFLTSMAMLGRFQPVAFFFAVQVATIVTVICFFSGVGKPPV